MFEHLSYIAKTATKVFLILWIPTMIVISIVALIHTLITGDWRNYGTEEKAENK